MNTKWILVAVCVAFLISLSDAKKKEKKPKNELDSSEKLNPYEGISKFEKKQNKPPKQKYLKVEKKKDKKHKREVSELPINDVPDLMESVNSALNIDKSLVDKVESNIVPEVEEVKEELKLEKKRETPKKYNPNDSTKKRKSVKVPVVAADPNY